MKSFYNNKFWLKLFLCLPLVAMLLVSCRNEFAQEEFASNELKLSVPQSEVLKPEMYRSNYTFSWTTGSNMGTSASISYKLEIDKAENNFANPIEYDLGKNKFTQDINISTLNNILVNTFGATPGKPIEMQARVTATFGDTSVAPQVSVVNFKLTPFYPLTENLYIVGSASPSGWNIANAIQMTRSSSDASEFVYSGELKAGEFKFPVNTDGCWCQDFYTKNSADENKMVLNIGGSGDDLKWSIAEPGMYTVKVNIVTLAISIEKQTSSPFSQLWIVGDATPSGWNVETPLAFTQTANPFVFELETNLKAGGFKILAGATGDWCGKWYRPLADGQSITETGMNLTSGCDNDFKWSVTAAEAGRYKITLNLSNNTIKVTPVEVYLIGSATPNAWKMGSLVPMTKNGSVYTWTGHLSEGEFKFTKFNTDWCQGVEIVAATSNQSLADTRFMERANCQGDDNKWVVKSGQEGTYTITFDLNAKTLTIK